MQEGSKYLNCFSLHSTPQSDSSFDIQWVIGQCEALSIIYENTIEKILQDVSTTEDVQEAIFNCDSTSFKYDSPWNDRTIE